MIFDGGLQSGGLQSVGLLIFHDFDLFLLICIDFDYFFYGGLQSGRYSLGGYNLGGYSVCYRFGSLRSIHLSGGLQSEGLLIFTIFDSNRATDLGA